MSTARMTSANGWLVCPTPRPGAQLRLLAIPSAGMGAGLYHGWGAGLPSWVELWAVAAPGREHRLSLPPPDRLTDHVDAIATAMRDWHELPFVVFGHSMGSMVGFELVRALREQGRPLPTQLFVSSLRPPWVAGDDQPEHLLPGPALLQAVRTRYGGMPPELEAFPEVLEWALDVLRSDLRALERHPFAKAAPLPLPIWAMGGDADPSITLAELEAWAPATTNALTVRPFSGNHRYLETARAEVLAFMRGALREAGQRQAGH